MSPTGRRRIAVAPVAGRPCFRSIVHAKEAAYAHPHDLWHGSQRDRPRGHARVAEGPPPAAAVHVLPIPGASRPETITDSVQAAELQLSEAQLERLNAE